MWMVFMTQHANCKRYSCKKLLRYMALVLPRGLGADHLTLEVGGGGGRGDVEEKIPASACWKKNIACSTNEIEKDSCTTSSKKKKCCKAISSFLGGFTKSQQNCNHSR